MKMKCGIRRENKNKWEARTPLVPSDVKELSKKGIEFYVQPSRIRAFKGQEYIDAGARIKEDLSDCPVILGVKEMPSVFFERGKTYVFFAHVIKGQKFNMQMLKRMMELECNLIDYEKIEDEKGRRLIFFGRYAGLAGVVDTFWAFGQRLLYEGIENPFAQVKKAYEYSGLNNVKGDIEKLGRRISQEGLSSYITPLIIGITGYGHVSGGVQEIVDLLPIETITPDELLRFDKNKGIFKVVFREEDMVEPIEGGLKFELEDYYTNPEKYRSRFHKYLSRLSMVLNCIYWEPKYPRLVSKKTLRELFSGSRLRLKVIGDISCDIEGSIEATIRTTEPDMPVFSFDPIKEKALTGFKGDGIVIMAVDNLPCELPIDSSTDFSGILKRFIPSIVSVDYTADYDRIKLPPEIKRALILHRGRLTSEYKYIKKFLS